MGRSKLGMDWYWLRNIRRAMKANAYKEISVNESFLGVRARLVAAEGFTNAILLDMHRIYRSA